MTFFHDCTRIDLETDYLVIGAGATGMAVNGGDKSDHSAAQIQAIGRAPSGKTRALSR